MSLVLSGLKAWVWQRISALVILLGSIYLLYNVFVRTWDYNTWHAWITEDLRLAFILSYIAALTIHSWIGIRDVILDYVKPFVLRFLVLLAFGFGLSALGIWVTVVLIRSASGT